MRRTLLIALLLAACDVGPVREQRLQGKAKPEKDTSPLQAADFAGYDGKRLRKSVDTVIDASRKRNEAIERALEGNP